MPLAPWLTFTKSCKSPKISLAEKGGKSDNNETPRDSVSNCHTMTAPWEADTSSNVIPHVVLAPVPGYNKWCSGVVTSPTETAFAKLGHNVNLDMAGGRGMMVVDNAARMVGEMWWVWLMVEDIKSMVEDVARMVESVAEFVRGMKGMEDDAACLVVTSVLVETKAAKAKGVVKSTRVR